MPTPPKEDWIKSIENPRIERDGQEVYISLTINGVDVEISKNQKGTLIFNGCLALRARSAFLDRIPEIKLRTGEKVGGCTNNKDIFQLWLNAFYHPGNPQTDRLLREMGYTLPTIGTHP